MLEEDAARSTNQNAENVIPFLACMQPAQATVVTSRFHRERAALCQRYADDRSGLSLPLRSKAAPEGLGASQAADHARQERWFWLEDLRRMSGHDSREGR